MCDEVVQNGPADFIFCLPPGALSCCEILNLSWNNHLVSAQCASCLPVEYLIKCNILLTFSNVLIKFINSSFLSFNQFKSSLFAER